MKLKRVKIHNFIMFEDVDVNIDSSIFFITGENRSDVSASSNGAGKSMLFQAICWAMYGDLLRKGLKADGVVGAHDKFTQVSLWFDKDGDEIEITRYRKHPKKKNSLKVFYNGVDVSLHKNGEEKVHELMGLSHAAFYYSSYSAARGESFVGMRPAHAMQLALEILEMERFDRKLKDIRSKKRDLSRVLELDQKKLESSRKGIQEGYDLQRKWVDSRVKEIETINEEIVSIEETIKDAKQNAEKFKDLPDEVAALSAEVDALEEALSTSKTIERNFFSQQKKVASKERKYAEQKSVFDQHERAYKNLTANPDGCCDFCGNPLAKSPDIKERTLAVQEMRDYAFAHMVDAQVDLEESEKKLVKLKDQYEMAREGLEEFAKKTKELQKLERKNAKLTQFARDIRSEEKYLKTLRTRLETVEGEIGGDARSEELELLESQISRHETAFSEASKAIEEGKRESKLIEHLELAVKETKQELFNDFIYSLDDRINENFDEMTDGDFRVYIFVNGDKLEFKFVNSSKEEPIPYHLFSDGERARIDVCVNAAMNEILGSQIYIDDEGIKFVDEAGIPMVLEFILEKYKNKTLFFISHDNNIKDYFKGCQNLHVIKEDGKSRVERRLL